MSEQSKIADVLIGTPAALLIMALGIWLVWSIFFG